jgi:hypothetical protein
MCAQTSAQKREVDNNYHGCARTDSIGLAANRLECALKSRKKLKQLAAMDKVEWALEHGYYVNMGAFAIKANLLPQQTRRSETRGHETVVDKGKHSVPTPTAFEVVSLGLTHLPKAVPTALRNADGIELSHTGGRTSLRDIVPQAASGEQLPRCIKDLDITIHTSPTNFTYIQ